MIKRTTLAAAVLALTAAAPRLAHAQEERLPRWGFKANFGTGSLSGDFKPPLKSPVAAEINIFRTHGPWRVGLGLGFSSFVMDPPFDDELEWGFQQTYLSATRMLKTEGTFRPYLEGRVGLARLHPRSELFKMDPLPEDFETGDSPTRPANGFSAALIPGVEWNLNKKVALDLSASFSYFSVDEYDLAPVEAGLASSGTTFQARLGVRWHPDDGYPAGPASAGSPPKSRDAWGVGHNYGWAAAEVLGINLVSSGINEYVRVANFNQISPRSWWENLDHGFTFDDNEFRTNQYIHPFNGAAYFNSGRANGLGEMQYRLSSEILNNRSKGTKRVLREVGAFVVDPVRGFNRVVSGRSGAQHDNPVDPMDWRPPHNPTLLMVGVRTIGEGESITDDTKNYFNIALDHAYGSPFDNTRRKAFDYMDVAVQISANEKVPLNVVRIHGDLWQHPFGNQEAPNQVLSVFQRFDYMNNTAFEYGGQSLGVGLHSRYRLSDKLGLVTRADGLAMILGAVNSEYAVIADVPDRERLREYDYGPGLGLGAQANLTRSGHPLLSLAYRFQWINVRNGSIFSKGDSNLGSDAEHYIQAAMARLVVPVYRSFGVGADGGVFLRKSRYSAPGFNDIDQRNPQVRVFLTYSSGG
jgi:opacity protein-like surface antigen